MKKKEHIVRYTADQVKDMVAGGADRTDWARAERSVAEPDEDSIDWSRAQVTIPGPKSQLTMRLDQDVVAFFKAGGKGYQTRINAVLRSYMDAQRGR